MPAFFIWKYSSESTSWDVGWRKFTSHCDCLMYNSVTYLCTALYSKQKKKKKISEVLRVQDIPSAIYAPRGARSGRQLNITLLHRHFLKHLFIFERRRESARALIPFSPHPVPFHAARPLKQASYVTVCSCVQWWSAFILEKRLAVLRLFRDWKPTYCMCSFSGFQG